MQEELVKLVRKTTRPTFQLLEEEILETNIQKVHVDQEMTKLKKKLLKKKSLLDEESPLVLQINDEESVQEEQEEQVESLKEALDCQSEEEESKRESRN